MTSWVWGNENRAVLILWVFSSGWAAEVDKLTSVEAFFSPLLWSIAERRDIQDEWLKWCWKDKGGIGVWVCVQLRLWNAVIAPVGTTLTSGTLRRGMEVNPAEFQRSCLFGFMVSQGIKYVIRYTILSLCLFIVFAQACNFVQSVSLNHSELSNLAHLGHREMHAVCCFRSVCFQQ